MRLREILDAVAQGTIPPERAEDLLQSGEVRYLDGLAVLDTSRAIRKGVPEVVYAGAKTPEQVAKICAALVEPGRRVIVSAASGLSLIHI